MPTLGQCCPLQTTDFRLGTPAIINIIKGKTTTKILTQIDLFSSITLNFFVLDSRGLTESTENLLHVFFLLLFTVWLQFPSRKMLQTMAPKIVTLTSCLTTRVVQDYNNFRKLIERGHCFCLILFDLDLQITT